MGPGVTETRVLSGRCSSRFTARVIQLYGERGEGRWRKVGGRGGHAGEKGVGETPVLWLGGQQQAWAAIGGQRLVNSQPARLYVCHENNNVP